VENRYKITNFYTGPKTTHFCVKKRALLRVLNHIPIGLVILLGSFKANGRERHWG
jgi:hypothetical protein